MKVTQKITIKENDYQLKVLKNETAMTLLAEIIKNNKKKSQYNVSLNKEELSKLEKTINTKIDVLIDKLAKKLQDVPTNDTSLNKEGFDKLKETIDTKIINELAKKLQDIPTNDTLYNGDFEEHLDSDMEALIDEIAKEVNNNKSRPNKPSKLEIIWSSIAIIPIIFFLIEYYEISTGGTYIIIIICLFCCIIGYLDAE